MTDLTKEPISPTPPPIFPQRSSDIASPWMETILQSAPVGILILDAQARIVGFNTKAKNIVSQNIASPIESLLHSSLFEFCHQEEDRAILRSLLESRSDSPLSLTLQIPSETTVHCRIQSIPIDSYTCVYLEDMSETLTLEEELSSFKTAINSAEDAIFIIDKNGMIFFTNPAFENHVGLSQEQILGRDIQCFWSDFDPPAVHHYIRKCFENAIPWSGEMTWIRNNHTPFEVEMRLTPIFSNENHLVGFICIQRDISVRKKIEKKLVDYSDNLERLVVERTEELANLHDIAQLFHSTQTLDKRLRLLLISATANQVFRFNRAFLLLVDKSNGRLEGRIAFGPSSPEEAGQVWNRVAQIPQSNSLSYTLQNYLNHAGEGENRANQIAQRIGVSLSNQSSLLIQAINKRCAFVVKNGTSDVSFDPILLQQMENDHFAVIPLLVQNEPIGVLIVDNIITRRPIQEDDIQLLEILAAQAALAIAHADAMEKLDRKVQETETAYAELRSNQEKMVETSKFAALGQMAATVAHEIRTPLVAIGGFVNLLLEQHSPDDSEYTHLKIVRDEALRLEDVLNRLLFYARPSLPQFEMNSIQELIQNVLSFLETACKDFSISVQTCLAEIPPFPFDRNQMRQVLMNIFQNGIQSMEKGGKLWVIAHEEDNEIFIEIRDTGVGISPENLSRIFEPFFTTKHTGTGLGMHISQRIVQNHGGSIRIVSQLNEGTIITILLPRMQEKS